MQVNTNRHSYKHIDATRVRLIPINIYKNTTYRQTLTPTGKQTDTHTQVQTHRHKGKHAETIVDTQAQIKHTNTMKDINTARQKNIDIQLKTYRHNYKHTDTTSHIHVYPQLQTQRANYEYTETPTHRHTQLQTHKNN